MALVDDALQTPTRRYADPPTRFLQPPSSRGPPRLWTQPGAEHCDLQHREREREKQRQDGQGGAIAGVADYKSLLEDVRSKDFARMIGATAGHQVHDRKCLKRSDHPEQKE